MKKNIRGIISKVLVAGVAFNALSCKDVFDLSPEDALEYDKAYQNVFDANALVWGIYSKFQRVASQYMVLSELRGDLEDVTDRSDKYLREINEHNVSEGNTWVNPQPFYELITNCNDALYNFDLMLKTNRISQADYNIHYSEIGALRSWIYLQLGIHYGKVPYITDPLISIKDAQDESKYPVISFEELLNKLVTFTRSLPNLDPVPSGYSLIRSIEGYNTSKMFINKYVLMADLYLWQENWQEAARYYYKLMNYGDILYPAKNSEQWYETYKVAYTSSINGANWSAIFKDGFDARYANYENVWVLPFDKNYEPKNPFIDLYSYEGGYKIKPSLLSIQNWDKQRRTGNAVIDVNRGEGASYRNRIAGNPNSAEILKLVPNYSKVEPFETNGKWILSRAAQVHLRYAEAVTNVGRDRLAVGLLNYGIGKAFDPSYNPVTNTTVSGTRNVTNIMQSDTDVNSIYYFDARNGEGPSFRSPWYRHTGIRNRAGLKFVAVDSTQFFDMNVPERTVTDRPGLNRAMEDLLIDEAALELAYEGQRWSDLLRIARRRKAIDPNYLANKIAAKFEAKGDFAKAAEVRTRLSNEANWYLPFKF